MLSGLVPDIGLPLPRRYCAGASRALRNGEETSSLRSAPAFRPHRCGIVLAAGDGTRLRPLVFRLRGKALPKQYVSFVGPRSMLEHTLSRAEKIISPQRLFTVVARDHLRHPEVVQQLSGRPEGRVVVQPENRDTGPGLLLPLLQLRRHYADSVVAVFPSDHFIEEEDRFMHFVRLAFRAVERRPDRMVLLGVEPLEPEPEYGYILPERGARPALAGEIRSVRLFEEKPDPARAGELMRDGGLWNTLVLVFHSATLLNLLGRAAPDMLGRFRRIEDALGGAQEESVVEETYRKLTPLNLSRDFLEPLAPGGASRLAVLAARGVTWSDWGSERRIPLERVAPKEVAC